MTDWQRQELESLRNAPSLNEAMRQRFLELLALERLANCWIRGKQ